MPTSYHGPEAVVSSSTDLLDPGNSQPSPPLRLDKPVTMMPRRISQQLHPIRPCFSHLTTPNR